MLKITCHAAPTQVEGTYNGKYVYLRERHGFWYFGVGDSQDEAVGDETVSAECPEFMDPDHALELATVLAKIYLGEEVGDEAHQG